MEDLGLGGMDFYVVGSKANDVTTGVVHHYTGTGFEPESLPAGTPGLNVTWGRTDGVVYAVGDKGVVVARVSGTWSTVIGPLATVAALKDVSGFENDAIAVGADGTILRIAP